MTSLKVLQPQELDVYYILPAIRRELTLQMKAQGLDQKETAKRLRVTESAISQYVNSKRAAEVQFTDNIKTYIKKVALTITDEMTLMQEMQHILKLAHEERIICKLHEKLNSVPNNCDVCFHD